MTLNGIQIDVAREIVNTALAKAADSLSSFVQQKVQLRSIDLKILRREKRGFLSDKQDDSLVFLKTAIHGEMEGNCYLILSREEAQNLINVALPKDSSLDPMRQKTMGMAALVEIDNIITASVIAQFSSFMKYDLYGHVPEIREISREEINARIQKENKLSNAILNFKAKLIAEHQFYEPEFIWILNSERFIKGVNRYLGVDEPQPVQFKLGLSYD